MCGPFKCVGKVGCMREIAEYKFYLAFENMFCYQYITEKVWRTLSYTDKYVIPVVMGGGDYVYNLPPYSYIDIRNFRSPKELVRYLKYLDKNDTAFNEYFKWRQYYKAIVPNTPCELCDYVNNLQTRSQVKRYDLHNWWTAEKCMYPHHYFRGVADMLEDLPRGGGAHMSLREDIPVGNYVALK